MEFSVRRWRRNVETANPRELKTLHVGKTRTTHGSKSHHGLRKWNSSLHHASSLKSFRTAFTNEHSNCKTEEGNDTANARILAAHEKAFDCYDSCRESESYRTSVFLVFSLHTRTYTKCIWQLELSVRETSDTTTEWFYNGSYILHEGRSWSWCHIILARVQFEYHSVWSSCTLGRGDKYQQDVALLIRSIIAGFQRIRELYTGCQQLTTCSWVLKSSFRNSSSGAPI